MEQQGRWLALLLLGVMVSVIAMGWWLKGDMPASAVSAQQFARAGEAAAQGRETPSAQRPEFVSALEWQVLQGVAARHAEPEKELRRLVEKLRFSKLQEEWQQLETQDSAPGRARRRVLATLLLADIPARLQAGDMDKPGALRLQQELLADIEPDAASRALRAEAEAARLDAGVLQAQP